MVATHELPKQESFITAGFGLKFVKGIYLDFAYQYGRRTFTDYQTFYAIDSEDETLNIQSDLFSTKTRRHIAVITFGVRF
jgi:hypothetical protein